MIMNLLAVVLSCCLLVSSLLISFCSGLNILMIVYYWTIVSALCPIVADLSHDEQLDDESDAVWESFPESPASHDEIRGICPRSHYRSPHIFH